jgi:hypothetical protein
LQSALYSEKEARKANLTLEILGLPSWEKAPVEALQAKVGAKPVDGWFGQKSIAAWKKWAKKHQPEPVRPDRPHGDPDTGCVIVGGHTFRPPEGVTVVNYAEACGIPAQLNDTSPRKHPVTQFVLHRGWGGSYKPGINFAAKTEDVLDARGLSTTFSQDIDGTIYQHFDPVIRRGRHATHHNVQSDSLDIGGPFSIKSKPAPGQEAITLKMAIGRKNDGKPPLARGYAPVKCWTMPEAQIAALALFLPWWCNLRGIPLTACEDWRCFRLGGAGQADPVTNVEGILAHTQISGPGGRVDGILPLHHLKERGVDLGWRSGEDFFNQRTT